MKKTLLVLIMIFLFPCLVLAEKPDATLDEMAAPINSIYGVTLGDDYLKTKAMFAKDPYRMQWHPQFTGEAATKFGIIYLSTDISNIEVTKSLQINSDMKNAVNMITYVLAYRTNGEKYTQTLDKLINDANEAYGPCTEQEGIVGDRAVTHRIWQSGERVLTVVAYYLPGYDPQHPYFIRIART